MTPRQDQQDQQLAHFDVDAIAAAQQAPTITIGRLLYRGRLLSVEEWLPFWERMQRLDAEAAAAKLAGGDPHSEESRRAAVTRLRDRTDLYRAYLTAVFPARRFKWWAPNPVQHVMAQPFAVVEETVAFFFILQALATFGKEALSQINQTTPGSVSPSKTEEVPPPGASEAA